MSSAAAAERRAEHVFAGWPGRSSLSKIDGSAVWDRTIATRYVR